MIEVKNLVKRYGETLAVDHVSFKVEKGRILGFLGPNGAGKTTTMRIITGFMPPTEGEATIGGFNILTQPMDARRRIGYLPETPPLYPDLLIEDYLAFAARIKGVPRKQIAERTAKVAAQCGIRDVLGRRIGVLSKGYRQRVGLAQALIHDPDVLILDEPTIGLDPNQIQEIRKLIRSLAGAHTVILSTHILPEVTMTCDDVIIINRGRIAAADTLEHLTQSGGARARTYLRLGAPDSDAQKSLQKTPGVATVDAGKEPGVFYVTSEPNADPSADIGVLALQRGWGLLELRHERPTLEEVFSRLTIGEEGAADA
jgi:ABC-2 type transport system ATP-binding protein